MSVLHKQITTVHTQHQSRCRFEVRANQPLGDADRYLWCIRLTRICLEEYGCGFQVPVPGFVVFGELEVRKMENEKRRRSKLNAKYDADRYEWGCLSSMLVWVFRIEHGIRVVRWKCCSLRQFGLSGPRRSATYP